MTTTEFKQLVKEMRQAQIDYFRTRDKDCLILSKGLEKRVDAALNEEFELMVNLSKEPSIDKQKYSISRARFRNSFGFYTMLHMVNNYTEERGAIYVINDENVANEIVRLLNENQFQNQFQNQ